MRILQELEKTVIVQEYKSLTESDRSSSWHRVSYACKFATLSATRFNAISVDGTGKAISCNTSTVQEQNTPDSTATRALDIVCLGGVRIYVVSWNSHPAGTATSSISGSGHSDKGCVHTVHDLFSCESEICLRELQGK